MRWERLDGQSLESANISFEMWSFSGAHYVFSTLQLCNVQHTDGGVYSCIANNSVGEIYYNFTIALLHGKTQYYNHV